MKKLVALSIIILFYFEVVAQKDRPNVLIIISDDQGWGDAGFNGCTDIPTPHLDQLATEGRSFEAGYASHPYCSPSRAGLLSGRYQHRFGHENNTPYQNPTDQDGLPIDELLIPELLQKNGYNTCAIGKWHLGDHEKFWPTNRGFGDWFGFFGGGMSYWGGTGKKSPEHGVLRNGKVVPTGELSYLTDDFSREASSYIEKYAKSEKPFFMYLAYNAPHAPIQATSEYLEKVSHIEYGDRAAYAAMVVGMDTGIGRVVETLKKTGEYDNTLIVFYSDNGGHTHSASSEPFRGHKGMLFEGGIRVPFLVSWPKGLNKTGRYANAISALDIYPTILAATGVQHPQPEKLDGVDLLPFLNNPENGSPHQTLFWRYSDGAGFAVRHGKHKLVMSGYKQDYFLFDLEKDPYEHHNLAAKMPARLEELKGLYEEWGKGTIQAKWQDPHAQNVLKEEARRQDYINKAKAGERNAGN